jgi:ferredoxin-NADP reductase
LTESVTLKVVSTRRLTSTAKQIEFTAADGGQLAAYSSGAHVKFRLPAGERSYSLIDFEPRKPGAGASVYRFAVLLETEGAGGSRFMHGLEPGDKVEATLPVNDFPLDPDTPSLLLAGGIGITPMIGMAAALKAAGTPFRFHYACRSVDAMAYRNELIIEVLEESTGCVDLIYDCQRGDCGICQTDVVSGVPDHRDVVLSEAEKADRARSCKFASAGRKSARLVLDL